MRHRYIVCSIRAEAEKQQRCGPRVQVATKEAAAERRFRWKGRRGEHDKIKQLHQADVAQLVEQPIRNRQVIGSSPIVGSTAIPFRKKTY